MSRSRNSTRGSRLGKKTRTGAGEEYWSSRLYKRSNCGDGPKGMTHRMERKDGKAALDAVLNRHRMVPLEEQWR